MCLLYNFFPMFFVCVGVVVFVLLFFCLCLRLCFVVGLFGFLLLVVICGFVFHWYSCLYVVSFWLW